MWEKQEEGGENTQMKETTKDANKDISSHSPFQQSSLSFSVGNYKS